MTRRMRTTTGSTSGFTSSTRSAYQVRICVIRWWRCGVSSAARWSRPLSRQPNTAGALASRKPRSDTGHQDGLISKVLYHWRSKSTHPDGRTSVRVLEQIAADRRYLLKLRKSGSRGRSEEHTSELQSPCNLVCRLLLEKKNT